MPNHYSSSSSFFMLLGRICMSFLFINASYIKIIAFSATAQTVAAKGILFPDASLLIATVIESLGALSILFGLYARVGAVLLLIFTVIVTFYLHSFWTYEGVTKVIQASFFYKNLAISGGLLFLLGVGAGRYSIDGTMRSK